MHMSLFRRSSDLLLNPFLPNSSQCSHLLISDFFKRPWKIVCSTIFKIYFTNAYIHLEAKKQNSFLHRRSSISGLPMVDNVLTFDQRNHKIWFDYYMAVSYFQTDSFLLCSFHSRSPIFCIFNPWPFIFLHKIFLALRWWYEVIFLSLSWPSGLSVSVLTAFLWARICASCF